MQELAGKSTSRIEIIDVLRGFTLLGIALVHFPEQYYAGQPPDTHKDMTTHGVIDTVVSLIVGIFITGKFFMIFSFLFGMSFYIQLSKSDGSVAFFFRFAWRLIVLFLIGLVHHLHYRGDILTIYAVLGFGLLISYKLPDKVLLIIALALVFNVPSLILRTIDIFSGTPNSLLNADQSVLEKYLNTFKSGTYTEIIRANWHEFQGKVDFQFQSGRVYITLGLFLLGLYAGRKNVFSNPVVFKKYIITSLWILLGAVIVTVSIFGVLSTGGVQITPPIGFAVGGAGYDVFNACLSCIYVGIVVTLFQKEKWKSRLMNFYAVGRMGLTTYLMQAVAGVLIFSGMGLGLLGEIGAALSALIGIAYFVLQMIFSNYWFTKFRFGPVEWLWRTLTYFKIQPF